ncbi:MAG: glycosyl hydrolase family 18 protein [Microgenomates group bacterium]
MRKFFGLGLVLLVIFLGFYLGNYFLTDRLPVEKKVITPTEKVPKETPTPEVTREFQLKKSIFVPQWQIGQLDQLAQLKDYERLIYFGSEAGLKDFITKVNSEKNQSLWFTYKINEIPPENIWEKITQEKIEILKKFNLEGIVLDLEISGLPTEKKVAEINNFNEYFLKSIKEAGFKNAVAIYGDTFYRKRPYDLNKISHLVDEVMVMAYDFSKSYGQPGPNFPYEGKEKYGYDFKAMIDDFLKWVPLEKLSVIFGMYGHDWQVDEKKRPISQAKALTLNQIKEKFLRGAISARSDKNVPPLKSKAVGLESKTSGENELGEIICQFENCLIKRDDLSKEVEINYVISSDKPDDQGIYRLDYHIVWFEDEKSVEIKTDYLKVKGINNIIFWALNYF